MKKALLALSLILTPTLVRGAIRTKTVEYAWVQDTASVAAGTVRTLTARTINIPETTNRTFRSVYIMSHIQSDNTTAASPTSIAYGFGIDAVAFSTKSVSDTMTTSGENESYTFYTDVTAYFVTNFTGTSHTVRLTTNMAVAATTNVSAKLIITYEYDDSETTRLKTVRIPIASSTSTITTSLAQIGQVPDLDDFLPEASKTYRDIFFESHVNEGTVVAVAGNPTLTFALDAEGGTADGAHMDDQTSARYYYRIWSRTDMTTSDPHAFKAATSNLSMPFPGLSATLVVTYEYNHTNSTRIMNSLVIPAASPGGFSGGTVPADQSRSEVKFYIEEPGTITSTNSGVNFFFSDDGNQIFAISAGYTLNHSSFSFGNLNNCGDRSFSYLIPDGGFTLQRGTNTIVLNYYRTTNTAGNMGTTFNGVLYLNYSSDKSSQSGGDANHNHTVYWSLEDFGADSNLDTTSDGPPIITETSYWLNALGMAWATFVAGTTQAQNGFNMTAEVIAGEAEGDGWRDIYSALYRGDAELGMNMKHSSALREFKRWPLDFDTCRLNLETSRIWRNMASLLIYSQLQTFYTYHSTSYTVTGAVTGYSGDGSGITVRLFRSANDEKLATATTAAGGTFSAVIYDNTSQIYADARQSSSLKGRSDTVTVGDAVTIPFSTGSGGGGGAFTFVQ